MEKPLVSVLMPVYNAQKYLAEAIESILKQTFHQFEFVIIDDCSTDNSSEIIKSFDDPRIRYFRNDENSGITESLNKGINLCGSDLIARMDADDISYSERLQKQFDYMQLNSGCALLSTRANLITPNKELIYTDTTDSDYYYFKLTFTSPFFHPSVMYRKDAVKKVGMYTVPYAEDFELFWQLSRKYKFYNLPEVLLDYRVSDESLFHVKKKGEYAEAVYQQCIRNIRFYTGNSYSLSESHIKCFQLDFELLFKERSIKSIVECIRELDFITSSIINTKNINRDVSGIQRASLEKRNGIIDYFVAKLSYIKKIILLAKLGNFKRIVRMISGTISDKFSKALRSGGGPFAVRG